MNSGSRKPEPAFFVNSFSAPTAGRPIFVDLGARARIRRDAAAEMWTLANQAVPALQAHRPAPVKHRDRSYRRTLPSAKFQISCESVRTGTRQTVDAAEESAATRSAKRLRKTRHAHAASARCHAHRHVLSVGFGWPIRMSATRSGEGDRMTTGPGAAAGLLPRGHWMEPTMRPPAPRPSRAGCARAEKAGVSFLPRAGWRPRGAAGSQLPVPARGQRYLSSGSQGPW